MPPNSSMQATMSHIAYIGIGSNLGDRSANYQSAVAKISALEETRVRRWSSLYETEPHGKARNWFINGVIEIATELGAKQLLSELQRIENKIGRRPSKTSVSRKIDLDILTYDNDIIDTRTLKIPHPEIQSRRFVLMPLSELAPGFKHPLLGKTVSSLLATTEDTKRVMLLPPQR